MTDTIYSQTLNDNDPSLNGITFVQRFEVAALTLPVGNISSITVRFEASTTEGLIVTNAYIGHAAASGDAYDFLATPVQLLFSGAANVSIGIGATATSDSAVFAYNKTSPLLIAWYVGGGTGADSGRRRLGLGSNIIRYSKTANDAATVDKTGYFEASGTLLAINQIQVEVAGTGFFQFI